jgi:hypothetical protein
LFGRQVALVLCGEAHEDTIDLTRRKSVCDADMGWIMVPPQPNQAGYKPEDALATKSDLTFAAAKKWAAGVVEKIEDKEDDDLDGAILVFASLGRSKGSAAVYRPKAKRSLKHQFPPGTIVMEWLDLDEKAREFNSRRLDTSKMPVPAEEQDALIAERKLDRLGEGIEFFDDWLIRLAKSNSFRVEFVLEAPVGAHEVEFHVEPGASPAPVAHEALRCMDPDSDEEEDRKTTAGNGSFLDTLRRQALAHFPLERVHCADPRVLGDSEDTNLPKALHGSFQQLLREAPPKCQEALELEKLGFFACNQEDDDVLPSWEGFLGGAADLLYHAHHVKANFVPFLKDCVGSADALRRFHDALYFGTIPQALSEITINEQTRPSASVRSLLHQSSDAGAEVTPRLMGHCSDRRKPIPIRAAPVDRYVKARGFDTPRTWVSGIAEQLRQAGQQSFVNKVKSWYWNSVNKLLADPKNADKTGDNFVAYLRAAHQEIFRDIKDSSETQKLRRSCWAKSKSDKRHRYDVKSMKIPSLEEAFEEFNGSKPSTPAASRREAVLGRIFVDAFQLRLVDLGMVLKTASAISSAPADENVVVVLYAGADHTNNIAKFWRSFGFSPAGLPNKGVVGKDDPESDEPKCLAFPSYLHDLNKLFPIGCK